MEETQVFDVKDVESNKVYAILAYLGILFLVPLLVAKDSPYARFHANQGLILFLGNVGCVIIMMIPIVGWIVGMIGSITLLVFAIIGIVNVIQGNAKELPLIGKYGIVK